jgi:hypothetical protein
MAIGIKHAADSLRPTLMERSRRQVLRHHDRLPGLSGYP